MKAIRRADTHPLGSQGPPAHAGGGTKTSSPAVSAVALVILGLGVFALSVATGKAVGALFGFGFAVLGVIAWVTHNPDQPAAGPPPNSDPAATNSLFEAFARQRRMSRAETRNLPEATPLLRWGKRREAGQVLRGALGDGVEGTLAVHTFTEKNRSDDAGKTEPREIEYRFTVALTEVPESLDFAPILYCFRSYSPDLEGLSAVLRGWRRERIRLESEALNRKYEIFASKDQDPNRIRQLFSPTFIVWLTEAAPEWFAFELENGVVCCSVPGHLDSTAKIDELLKAAVAVAGRIREEVAETHRTRG